MTAVALRWDGWARAEAYARPTFSRPSRPSIAARLVTAAKRSRPSSAIVTTIRIPVALLAEAGLPSSPGSRVNLHRDGVEIRIVPGIDFVLADTRSGEGTLLTLQLLSERLSAVPFPAVKVDHRVEPQAIALTTPPEYRWRADA